ncbi:mitochondrial carrier (BOU / S-adenosylmethionine carrier) [Achlya hypogyna]|uniref:Mitochondrial carrier (BOU / S-adenosylmethionine carrier) n=1 Tax=Achlya hypogyna TaxID=1202772 RepID=A0A1V9Z3X3_ACHHY|nr:mitochondrial carrier (BOU / S-adenosylmethionine carrier) [Achlya hypogyna]
MHQQCYEVVPHHRPLTNNAYTAFFANLVSGSVAGAVTDSILLPFDTINLRVKVQSSDRPKYTGVWHAWKTIVREEGVRGLFGGLGTTLMMAPINTGIYYAAYEVGKSTLTSFVPQEHEPVAHFAAGCFSELCSSVTNIPSEVIKSRMQMGANPRLATGDMSKQTTNYTGTFHAVSSIVRTEGIKGLYSGYGACLAIEASFAGFCFVFYEALKKQYIAKMETTPSTADTIAIGAVAGAGAAVLTNPLDVVTLRLMVQGNNKLYRGILHCLQRSLAEEGIQLLWKGSIIRMMSTVPNTGISFGVYEATKSFLNGQSIR